MRTVYRVLAILIAVEVFVQAAAIAFAVFGLTAWVDDGGVLDKATMEDESAQFDGVVGFMVHGINGSTVVPVLALLLLVASFFTRVPGATRWALLVLLLVGVQVSLGIFAHEMPVLGAFHGINALLLLGASVETARRASVSRVVARPAQTSAVPVG